MQGIHITRDPNDGVCYVIAEGTNNTEGYSQEFTKFLEGADGTEVSVHHDADEKKQEYRAEILPGEIKDVSFIPAKAHAECTKGYKWMTFVPIGKSIFVMSFL